MVSIGSSRKYNRPAGSSGSSGGKVTGSNGSAGYMDTYFSYGSGNLKNTATVDIGGKIVTCQRSGTSEDGTVTYYGSYTDSSGYLHSVTVTCKDGQGTVSDVSSAIINSPEDKHYGEYEHD